MCAGPGSCLLEANQLRHLDDCLCNDLAPLYFQLVASKTASKDPTLSERFQKVSAGSYTLPFLGCARVPGSCLLEAGQLRHLDDRLCNDLTALYFQIVEGQTASKDPMLE